MEILAPIGNSLRTLREVIAAGADAVYFGVRPPGSKERFSLLWHPFEMEWEQAQTALSLIQASGKKAYITLNSFYPERQLPHAVEFALHLYDAGATAIILSDPGFAHLLRREKPEAEIHVSVLGRTLNFETALFWKEYGVKRIILERVLNLEEIATIRQKADVDVELFLYGGFCYNYHGVCRLSNYFFGEMCLAPCKDPAAVEGLDPVQSGTHPFRSKSLNAYYALPALLKAGVAGLKIEGRQKNRKYVLAAVKALRKGVDALHQGGPLPDLNPQDYYFVAPPATTSGFYLGEETVAEMMDNHSGARHFLQSILPYLHPSGITFAYKRYSTRKKAKEYAGRLPHSK